jgi:hypothetical protein
VVNSRDQTETEEPEMNSLTSNPYAAGNVARQLIQDRVQDAERRAQVRALRADRRAARQVSGRPVVTPPETRDLPWWTFRFLTPAR